MSPIGRLSPRGPIPALRSLPHPPSLANPDPEPAALVGSGGGGGAGSAHDRLAEALTGPCATGLYDLNPSSDAHSANSSSTQIPSHSQSQSSPASPFTANQPDTQAPSKPLSPLAPDHPSGLFFAALRPTTPPFNNTRPNRSPQSLTSPSLSSSYSHGPPISSPRSTPSPLPQPDPTALTPSKSKRHRLADRASPLPRNSVSSSASKSATSFFTSHTSKTKQHRKSFTSSISSSSSVTHNSSATSGFRSPPQRHSLQLRPSPEQPPLPTNTSPFPATHLVLPPKPPQEDARKKNPTFIHPFATHASSASVHHLSKSSPAEPRASGNTSFSPGPPRNYPLAKSPQSKLPLEKHHSKKKEGLADSPSPADLRGGYVHQPTEPRSVSLEPIEVSRHPEIPPIAGPPKSSYSKMRAIFSRKASNASSLSATSSSSAQPFVSSPPPPPPPTLQSTKLTSKAMSITGGAQQPTSVFVHDQGREETCPVCHEDMTMRLQGEKPHVVPSCGHKLHATCFETVYGVIAEARKTSDALGCCGTCRRDMRLGEVVTGGPAPRTNPSAVSPMFGLSSATSNNMKGNKKLAAMTGELNSVPVMGNPKVHSLTRKAMLAAALPSESTETLSDPDDTYDQDPNQDDELSNIDDPSSARSDAGHRQFRNNAHIIQPVIQVLSESSSLSHQKDANRAQHITCMVSVEIPSRYPTASLIPTPASAAFPSIHSPLYNPSFISSPGSALSQPSLPSIYSPIEYDGSRSFRSPEYGRGFPKVRSYPTLASAPPSVKSAKASSPSASQEADMRLSAAEDLLSRIQNWKGHSPSDFGSLNLCDRLHVRKESNSREFLVYLFDKALLCVSEDQSRPATGGGPAAAGRLRLKGRVYIHHMSSVYDSSAESPLTLTIKMEDVNLDAFVMRFQERGQLESWMKTIDSLIEKRSPDRARERMPLPAIPKSPAASPERPTFSEEAKGATNEGRAETAPSSEGGYASSSFTGYTKATTFTSAPTLSSVGEEDENHDRRSFPTRRQTQRSSFAHSASPRHLHVPLAESITEPIPSHNFSMRTAQATPDNFSAMAFNPTLGAGAFNHEDLPPIDLLLMISIPNPSSISAFAQMPSSANMKLRLIKESLEFIIRHLHPRSRLSLIVYTVGPPNIDLRPGKLGKSQLKKTPFLCVGKASSRRRLEFVIEQIARAGDSTDILNSSNVKYYGEYVQAYKKTCEQRTKFGSTSLSGIEEDGPAMYHTYEVLDNCLKMTELESEDDGRISVVSAVNLAYDNILQRRQKNPLAGMLLVHDAQDLSTKAQMSLVMTRAEASSVPIHTIGWSKAHNPSCLLQLSNHTGGTYTFVKDLPTIKDVLMGCVGGMLSVGATNTRLQISVPEARWFKIKKVSGVENSVVSSDGHNADIEFGELRYGERRAILVEMEMSSGNERARRDGNGSGHREDPNQVFTGTDAFFLQNGAELKEIGMGDEGGAVEFYEAEFEQLCDDVPLLEVDASYRDPIACKSVSRLVRPILLSLTITPPRPRMNAGNGGATLGASNEPAIIRRRIELLTAGCLSRAMLLVSRRLERQAGRLLDETRAIVLTVLGSGESSLARIGRGANRKAQDQALAREVLMGCLTDLETMLVAVEELTRVVGEGLVESATESDGTMNEQRMTAAYHQFDSVERNMAAQQAGVLSNEKAWTARTLTEKNFWKADMSHMYFLRCMHSSST